MTNEDVEDLEGTVPVQIPECPKAIQRRVKIRAAMDGIHMKDLYPQLLELGLEVLEERDRAAAKPA